MRVEVRLQIDACTATEAKTAHTAQGEEQAAQLVDVRVMRGNKNIQKDITHQRVQQFCSSRAMRSLNAQAGAVTVMTLLSKLQKACYSLFLFSHRKWDGWRDPAREHKHELTVVDREQCEQL